MRSKRLVFLVYGLMHVVTLFENYWTVLCNVWLLTCILITNIEGTFRVCDIWRLHLYTDSELQKLLVFLLNTLQHVVTLFENCWTIICIVWLLTWNIDNKNRDLGA